VNSITTAIYKQPRYDDFSAVLAALALSEAVAAAGANAAA